MSAIIKEAIIFFFRLQISRATLGIIHHREGRIHCIVESSAQGVTTSPKTAGWETPGVMRQDAYTIYHTPKQKRPQEKNTYIHITICALSALQRPPAEGNRPADMARHTRHPGIEQPGARPGPPYYERTLSACAMSPHGRAARRETRPRYRANNGAEN